MSPLLELRKVSKRFGSTQALDSVDFDLREGEVHALVGENGAGKSTALGIMYGVVQPDSGALVVDGEARTVGSPAQAQDFGIGCVFQELSLADGISVAENIFAGRPPSKWGIVDRGAMNARASSLLASFDLDIDVRELAGNLAVSTKQVIEIAKALSLNSRVLLLDEPTSALTPDEVSNLHALIHRLTAKGIGVIYVSHHLPEIFRIADRVTVFRDGKVISTCPISETDEDRVVSEMIGQVRERQPSVQGAELGDIVLSVKGLRLDPMDKPFDLDLRRGEIVGFAGLVGAQAGSLVRAIAGIGKSAEGIIAVNGREVASGAIRAARRAGIAYVPDERKSHGLFLDFAVSDNLTSAIMDSHSRWGLWNRRSAKASSAAAVERFTIKASSVAQAVGALSGGNQQKVMMAKWLEMRPEVLIVNEPTKGVDVGAKLQIHNVLKKAASDGMAVLVVSSDFPELLTLADRILVVRRGVVEAEMTPDAVDENRLMAIAAGTG